MSGCDCDHDPHKDACSSRDLASRPTSAAQDKWLTSTRIDTAREVLARLSEHSNDPQLRDYIGAVRDALYDLGWQVDR